MKNKLGAFSQEIHIQALSQEKWALNRRDGRA